MKDWQKRKLNELLEVQNGFAFNSKSFSPVAGIPLIRIRDLKSGTDTETYFTGEYDKKYVVRVGDLLIGMDGEFGCYEWKGRPALLNQRVCRLQNFSSDISPRYLFYGINSYLKDIEEVTGYSTVKHLSSKQILAIEFFFPPLPEQRRIVGILDEAFESIATARANAEKNLKNARALFESHLQSCFENIWRNNHLVSLLDLATDITDGDHMPPPKVSQGIPFITIGNIEKDSHKINFDNTFMVSKDYFNRLKPNRKPKKGDVLYTVTGTFGVPVLINDNREFCFQRHIGLIRPKQVNDSKWLYYLLMSPQVMKQAIDGATGTAQKTISLRILRNFQVPFVTLEVQRTITKKLESVRSKTQRLESIYQRKLSALDELKKSLLNQAFSGEL